VSQDNGTPHQAPVEGRAEEILDDVHRPARPEPPGQALIPAGRAGGLIAAESPRDFLAKAQEVAEALVDVVRQQQFYVTIRGNKHPQVEAWQTLGALLAPFSPHGGVFPHTVWARPQLDPADGRARLTRYTVKERSTKGEGPDRVVIEREYDVEGYDYEARVEARTVTDLVVGTAEATCSRKESRWAQADDYAVKSMAQTRATSKALKAATGWLMVLAGYKATPAEEMPDEADEERIAAWARPAGGALLDQARTAVRELGGPHARLLGQKITAACGETMPQGVARALAYVAAARRAAGHDETSTRRPAAPAACTGDLPF
jgi:hypothetical protein